MMQPVVVPSPPTGRDLSLLRQRSWRIGRAFITTDFVLVGGRPWACVSAHTATAANRPGSSAVPAVISTALIPDNAVVSVDVDGVQATSDSRGLVVTLIGRPSV